MRARYLYVFLIYFSLILQGYSQPVVPDGFVVEWYSNEWDNPVDMDFDQQGNMYVTEKEGTVWIVKDDQKLEEPLIDLREEVGNWGDHGMLSFALDPHFEENGYFYLFYNVDLHHLLNYGFPGYNPNRNLYWRATVIRVTRYQTDASREKTDYSTRHVLIGDRPDNGIPSLYSSHTGGSLIFGDDGTLLVSTGDGSTWKAPYGGDGPPYQEEYVVQALNDNIIREDEEVGGFRSQLIDNRNGKLLRIDPLTGAGISSNPYYDAENPYSAKSQVFAIGFRNLWKMKLKPNTGSKNPEDGLPGSVYGMDVGNGFWEELNVIRTGGGNYGWPLFEGLERMPEFNSFETVNKQVTTRNDCGEGYTFKDLIQAPIHVFPFNEFKDPCNDSKIIDASFTHVMEPPIIAFAHKYSDKGFWVPTFEEDGTLGATEIGDRKLDVYGETEGQFGNCGLVGGFYESEVYPEEYHDKLFIADYSFGWIKYVETDDNDELLGIRDFFQDTITIAHMEINPVDGALYFIDYPNGIKRITYGKNSKPVALGKADSKFGESPLSINFSADDSYDPNGDQITYEWDFGDGNTSNEKNPTYIFQSEDLKSNIVTLTVTDEEGLQSTDEILISINNTPPNVDINSFTDGDLYSAIGVTFLDLAATVTDDEHDDRDLSYAWNVYLGHNAHEHGEPPVTIKNPEVRLLPAGCDGEQYYYRIELTVTDPLGLTGVDEKRLLPDCNGAFVDLFTFDARQDDQAVSLDWVTLREDGVETFNIQRFNPVTETFETIHTAEGSNLFQRVQKYNYVDNDPFLNNNIYRIQMTSVDGEIAISDNQEVFFLPADALFVFPNPMNDELSFLLSGSDNKKEFYLYDVSGSLVLYREFEATDQGAFQSNVSQLVPGVYTYQLINGSERKTGKLVKE